MRAQLIRRIAPIAVAGAACLLVWPQGARADVLGPECSNADDTCEVGVETPGSDGGANGGSETDGNGGNSDSAGAGNGGGSDADGCEYITVDPSLAPPSLGERPSPDHVLVARACQGDDAGSVGDFQWVEADEDGNLAIDPEVLAAQAIDNLRLPRPQIAASPETAQLVYLPVWLWLEGSSWETQSASASVPGLTVTARAVPVEATWDMGDGNTVTCDGPGTAWEQGMDPEASSPDCGHTYTQPSDDGLQAIVTVTWEVTWSGGGESGSVPGMETTASVAWPVVESHALVTR